MERRRLRSPPPTLASGTDYFLAFFAFFLAADFLALVLVAFFAFGGMFVSFVVVMQLSAA